MIVTRMSMRKFVIDSKLAPRKSPIVPPMSDTKLGSPYK